jgi:hypothetical protein
MPRLFRIPPHDPRITGGVLVTAGLALLGTTSLWLAALGLEAVALAFWTWARADAAAEEQIPRWAWLRRPALALWLAAAVHAVAPTLSHTAPGLHGTLRMLTRVEAAAIVWAGLELLAALPLARPYSDLPGPLLKIRPWIPVLLPAAGFVVLWRQATHWERVPEARAVAAILLLVTTLLATLRAFGRRQWTASLRWMVVADSALAGMLVALGTVSAEMIFLLWLASCGGRAFVLAGELRSAAPRRGAALARLWRLATWVSATALAWPVLLAVGFGSVSGPRWLYFASVGVPVALASWLTVRRMVRAPERRLVPRPGHAVTLSHVGAVITLGLGPLALLGAWWGGLEPSWPGSVVALGPAVVGGWLGLVPERADRARSRAAREAARAPSGAAPPPPARFTSMLPRLGRLARAVARAVFRFVIALEQRAVGLVFGFARTLVSPLRDLHTGDAQEYLLFLVGLSVLALVLPLLT